jgi:tRNA threonylcarbamoyladenosine biosynthesis protein TsaB
MKTLILETASEKSIIILAEKDRVVDVCRLSGGPELSKRLAQEVDALLKRARFLPERIAVGTGPGSYTGIRVGAALAKALAYGWKIPLTGFCSLKGFAPERDGTFAILTDARSAGLYALFGERRQGEFFFHTPELIQPSDPRLPTVATLAAPNLEALRKRSDFPGNWLETEPNPALLASEANSLFSSAIPSLLEFFYLSSP